MAVSVEEFDPFTAPLEELAARANAGEGPKPGEAISEPGRPRNADGTFTSPNQGAQPTGDSADPDEEEETIYQRRIDLGDGAGVQVFQAPSMEELVDKLVVAQENATKKIRQQAAEIEKNKPVVRERTPDEEFAISQELMQNPTKTFEKLFQDVVGMPISEFKSTAEAVKAFNQGKAADEAATQFVEVHPEYYAIPANGQKIQKYLGTYGLPATLENIEKAYIEVKELLAEKPAADGRQPEPVQVVVPKKKTSGLSSRGGAAPVAATKAPETLEEFEKASAGLSTAQIRALANNQRPTVKDPYDF